MRKKRVFWEKTGLAYNNARINDNKSTHYIYLNLQNIKWMHKNHHMLLIIIEILCNLKEYDKQQGERMQYECYSKTMTALEYNE